MMWKFTSGESEKISSDVIVNSLNSGLKTGEINPKGFTFMKYSSVNKDSTIFADYMYFNGSEAVKLANDIIY